MTLQKYSSLCVPFISVLAIAVLFLLPASSEAEHNPIKPYSALLEMSASGNSDSPWYALENFENSFQPQIHATNIEYLKTHPDIIAQIRSDLGEQTFEWHLKKISHRLLYSPENRPEYIKLYEAYCKDTITKVLSKLEKTSPYTQIVTLASQSLPLENTEGFSAYIVHDLTLEYRARYEFTNTSDKSVAIELSGQYATGEVGSYSSELVFDDKGKVHFIHDHYTVWQDNAKNAYTVLMTPVEETLHILLRQSTEAAIKAAVEARGTCSPEIAKKIVADWISVEEAVVGGLVYHLLPPILEEEIGPIPSSLISDDLETKDNFSKYRGLRQGIRLVGEIGYKKCLEMYLKDPDILKKDLLL